MRAGLTSETPWGSFYLPGVVSYKLLAGVCLRRRIACRARLVPRARSPLYLSTRRVIFIATVPMDMTVRRTSQ
jgi:hypothetical protein